MSCVVPDWIGLPRAFDEVAALPPAERPALIPPERIAGEVAGLVLDPGSAGRVVIVDPPE